MKTNLKDYIAVYNAIDKELCKEIVCGLNDEYWRKHEFNNPLTNTFNSYDDDFEMSYQNDLIDNKLNDSINLCLNDYLSDVAPNPFELQDLTKIRFNKYKTGTNMKTHHDHIHTIFDGDKKGIPILTVLGLLNDDFEGGDFLMFDNKKVNLEAGDVIIFPSNFLYPHSVTTVTKGTRYSFVSWGY